MTNKLLVWGGALTLSAVALASSKTYDVVLSDSMKAGSVQLVPGEYKVKVEGSHAVFTDMHTRKSITLPVKVEKTDTKYNATAVDTTKRGDAVQVTSIELGGSKTKIEFGQ